MDAVPLALRVMVKVTVPPSVTGLLAVALEVTL